MNKEENMSSSTKKGPSTVFQWIDEVLELVMKAETRSQIWDALYSTEYKNESVELNERMAAMTDKEVFDWFPKVMSEFLQRKVSKLR